ncbi:MAG: DUF308 domain-containing protein [Eubacteriaceae bacterium]|nr:DUF308 domain-containing protein [Eubacteriaceae bacterium]
MKQLKIAKNGYILISVIFYITGLSCIFRSDLVSENAELIAGIILIAYGVIKIIGYFSKDLYCLAFQYDFACGIFLIALGVIALCIMGKYSGPNLLADLGILILLDSLLSIQTSLDARNFGLETWRWILFLSVLSGALGAVLLIRNTMIVAGYALLAEGGMRHYIVHCTVQISGTNP